MRKQMIQKAIFIFTGLITAASAACAAELNVATNGNDASPGTRKAPVRTIQHAADLAQPGDLIMVHEGVYRERINPPRGGTSDKKRITYQAAPGEKAVITGSEIVKHWELVTNDTWKATIPNAFFGGFNPYADLIHGDWFLANGRPHHSGCVYLNGDWLEEAAKLEDALQPAAPAPLWFGEVTSGGTTIWAQFKDVNPNEAKVEINVRQTVFTPEKTGVNYITVRGFDLRNAATPWAPPTAGQIGIVSAYWCKGWIIEGNEISHSRCSGVALGKYSDEWDNRAESAEGYVGTLTRALTNGWHRATVGSHVVRNNHIHHCEQTGIVGSLGCSFSTITGNEIHDIHVRGLFSGYEQAGIKFHGAIDVVISHNHVYRCDCNGIWLDWMAQGAQVTGNLLHDNSDAWGDISFEMQHGPILVANNLFLSKHVAFGMNSQGIAFAHNLIAGTIVSYRHDTRVTPFQSAHSTGLAGMYPAAKGDSGDHHFYNNLFVAPCNLHPLDNAALPCFYGGNVFTKGAQPAYSDPDTVLKPDFDAGVKLEQQANGWYLTLTEAKAWRDEAKRQLVTTKLLGKTKVSSCAYENADGSPLCVITDYFGIKRSGRNPSPGPFEKITDGQHRIKVWPVELPMVHCISPRLASALEIRREGGRL